MDLPQLVVMTDHSKVTADKYPFIVGYDRDLTIEEAQEVVRRCELVSKIRNRLSMTSTNYGIVEVIRNMLWE